MSNEDEIRLKLDEIFSSIHITGKAKSIVQACSLAGIADSTFYTWDERVREEIKSTAIQRAANLLREEEEALQREKTELRLSLLRDAYRILRKGVRRMEEGIDDEKTGLFVVDKAVNTVLDLIRNELNPDKQGIRLQLPGQDEDERPKQVAAPVYPTLRPPGDIQPATDVRLASEVVERKWQDGGKERVERVYPDVIDGETTKPLE